MMVAVSIVGSRRFSHDCVCVSRWHSDICTCRPYLTHAIEECIKTAQRGGCGIVIYYRKEGRSLGEVTKYLVYNTRKRQEGGDSAERYFSCTEQVAGVQDTRFQALMPDPLHFLGVTKIHNFISMSDMKYNAIVSTGIKIVNRVEIPPEMVPVRFVNFCAAVCVSKHVLSWTVEFVHSFLPAS